VLGAEGRCFTHRAVKVIGVLAVIVVLDGGHDYGDGLRFPLFRSGGVGGGERFVALREREVVGAVACAMTGVETTAAVAAFVIDK
jgi:hypothetical protein